MLTICKNIAKFIGKNEVFMYFSAINSQNINIGNFNFCEIDNLDMNEIDPYSYEKFKDLLDLRAYGELDFYICVVKQDNRCYFFEASRFVEQIFRKNLRNPFTNVEMDCFEVLKYSNKNKCFEFYCDSDQINDELIYLPIIASDHSRSEEERLDCLYQISCCYLKEGNYDLNKSLEILIRAAEKGHENSQKKIGILMIENNEIDQGIAWLNKYLEKKSDSPMEYICLASNIYDISPIDSFNLFRKAAFMGNYVAIANTIDFYERNLEEDCTKARLWRETLPIDWQEGSMGEFILHLDNQGYDFNSTSQLSLPEELFC